MPLDTFQRYHVIGNIHSGCLVCKHWTNVNKAIKSQGDVLNQNLAAIFFSFFYQGTEEPLQQSRNDPTEIESSIS